MTQEIKECTAVEARVKLLAVTEGGEKLAASAARLCYASDPATIDQHEPADNARLIRQVCGMGHLSTIEHVNFTFLLEGVSRALTHQLVRHRVASYSQRSQRYVSHDSFEYIMPLRLAGKTVKTPAGDVPAEAYYHDTMMYLNDRYKALCEAIGGNGEECREDARYVLPNACETKIIVSMNARELVHFFGERLCLRAQWEIRHVANRMLMLCREACPTIFGRLGPKCVQAGKCVEGKLSCGTFKEVREKYDPKT